MTRTEMIETKKQMLIERAITKADNSYRDLTFTGEIRKRDGGKKLYANEKSPDTMDVCKVTLWDAKYIEVAKSGKSFEAWYTIHTDLIRLEKGAYRRQD